MSICPICTFVNARKRKCEICDTPLTLATADSSSDSSDGDKSAPPHPSNAKKTATVTAAPITTTKATTSSAATWKCMICNFLNGERKRKCEECGTSPSAANKMMEDDEESSGDDSLGSSNHVYWKPKGGGSNTCTTKPANSSSSSVLTNVNNSGRRSTVVRSREPATTSSSSSSVSTSSIINNNKAILNSPIPNVEEKNDSLYPKPKIIKLTSAAIISLSEDNYDKTWGNISNTTYQPILQIMSIKEHEVNPSSTKRYRVMVSDGENFMQGMLHIQLNRLLTSGSLKENSVIKSGNLACFGSMIPVMSTC